METNRKSFRGELEALINRYSMESGSDTPDFILADYLADSLAIFDKAVKRRTNWYGPTPTDEAPRPPKFQGVLCRGCITLGTDCGNCERCKYYRQKLNQMHGQPDDYIETDTTGKGFGRDGYKYRVMDRQKLRPTHHTNDIENARWWARECIKYWLEKDALNE